MKVANIKRATDLGWKLDQLNRNEQLLKKQKMKHISVVFDKKVSEDNVTALFVISGKEERLILEKHLTNAVEELRKFYHEEIEKL